LPDPTDNPEVKAAQFAASSMNRAKIAAVFGETKHKPNRYRHK
jgi:hypothetical protein